MVLSSSGKQRTSGGKQRINSRTKGAAFEREIAQDLREVYDSLELTEKLKSLPKRGKGSLAVYQAAMKESKVRRSDQGKGALEPDVVIRDCPFWFELQHAREATPRDKLLQAERDVQQTGSPLRPVAIVKKTGSKSIQAWMRFSTLLYLIGFDDLTDSEGHVIELASSPGASLMVTIDYDDLLRFLKLRELVRHESK